jgi:hypothetical protein
VSEQIKRDPCPRQAGFAALKMITNFKNTKKKGCAGIV